MPEGHTIHRLAHDMAELQGRTVQVTSPQGRFTEGAAVVDGAVLLGTEAYGKHLLLHTGRGRTVHVHLGMHGKWLRYSDPSGAPLRQVRLRLATGNVAWDLVAPSPWELLPDARVTALISTLGPDPLRPDADVEQALTTRATARGPTGAALLDQRLVAGFGNVFRSEALRRTSAAGTRPDEAGTHPAVDGAAPHDGAGGGRRPDRHRAATRPAHGAGERGTQGVRTRALSRLRCRGRQQPGGRSHGLPLPVEQPF